MEGVSDRRERVAELVGERGEELVLAAIGLGELGNTTSELGLQRLQGILGALPFGDVAEDDHHAGHRPVLTPDRGRAVLDRQRATAPRHQLGLCHLAVDAALDHLDDGHLGRLVGVLIKRPKDLLQRVPHRLGRWPSGQALGDRVQRDDLPLRVGDDHPIADAGEGRLMALALLALGLLGTAPLGNLVLKASTSGPAGLAECDQGPADGDEQPHPENVAGPEDPERIER